MINTGIAAGAAHRTVGRPYMAVSRTLVILFAIVFGLFAVAGWPLRSEPLVSAPMQEPAKVITILHTNDIHGHLMPWQGWEGTRRGQAVGGFATLATQVRRIRAEKGNDRVVLLDAGDTIGDTMIAVETKGGAVIEAMNALTYDAMVLGNHEPDFGAETLRLRLGEARFPMLSANVITSQGELFARPYVLRTVSGVRVGILGLAYPNTPLTSARRNVERLRFRPAADTAREYVPRLRREGAQIVIALTHLGLSADKQLATEVPGIDVIVGGHSHNRMTDALRVRNTLIVQAGAHGSDLGRLDLTVDDGRVASHHRTLIPLIAASSGSGAASDAPMDDLIARLRAPFAAVMEARIGRASSLIARAQTIAAQEPEARNAESPADDLFADAIRETSGTDLAFLPGLGYGVAIPPGDITAAQLRNLIPHDSAIWTMRMTGAQVREVLEQAIENVTAEDPTKKVGGMIQVSGMRFTYDSKAPRGSRVLDVTVGARPLQEDRRYRVATNALLAEGGHNYRPFTEAAERREMKGPDQYEVVRAWIARRGDVAPPATDRIMKKDAPTRQHDPNGRAR